MKFERLLLPCALHPHPFFCIFILLKDENYITKHVIYFKMSQSSNARMMMMICNYPRIYKTYSGPYSFTVGCKIKIKIENDWQWNEIGRSLTQRQIITSLVCRRFFFLAWNQDGIWIIGIWVIFVFRFEIVIGCRFMQKGGKEQK